MKAWKAMTNLVGGHQQFEVHGLLKLTVVLAVVLEITNIGQPIAVGEQSSNDVFRFG